MNNILKKNIKYLKKRSSDSSIDNILNANHQSNQFKVEEYQGFINSSVLNDDGKEIFLHSKRSPVAEAKRQVKHWFETNTLPPSVLLIVIGIASLYHLKELLASFKESGKILVIDLHPNYVKKVLEKIDITSLRKKDVDLHFIFGTVYDRIYNEAQVIFQGKERMSFSFFNHPGTFRAFSKKYSELSRGLIKRIKVDLMLKNTVMNLSKSWLNNALLNFPILVDSASVNNLKNIFKGIPAFVIAAGPSLENSYDLIKRLSKKVIIISVGTAYKPLLKMGIVPHFVILVDGSPLLKKQFENAPSSETFLLTPPQIDTEILTKFKNKLISFATGALPQFDAWMATFGEDIDVLRSGGTVTLSAMDIARYMGAEKIYTFGLDLAFKDNGLTHVANSMHDGNIMPKHQFKIVPGNRREKVCSNEQFALYIELIGGYTQWITSESETILYNVNDDGAKIANMINILPKEVGLDNQNDIADPFLKITNLIKGKSRSTPTNSKKALLKALAELNNLKDNALKAHNSCISIIKKKDSAHPDVQIQLVKLNKLEKKLSKKTPATRLVDAALQAGSMRTVSFCAGLSKHDDNQFQKIHRECADFYGSIPKEAQWVKQLLQKSLKM